MHLDYAFNYRNGKFCTSRSRRSYNKRSETTTEDDSGWLKVMALFVATSLSDSGVCNKTFIINIIGDCSNIKKTLSLLIEFSRDLPGIRLGTMTVRQKFACHSCSLWKSDLLVHPHNWTSNKFRSIALVGGMYLNARRHGERTQHGSCLIGNEFNLRFQIKIVRESSWILKCEQSYGRDFQSVKLLCDFNAIELVLVFIKP